MTATGGHPFWVPTLREWVDAGDLRPGQWLQTGAGTHVQISATETTHEYATVHNLTIAGIHTYYVLSGNTSALVHNSSCRTFGFEDSPNVPGVYSITMKDGRVYVESSSTNVHGRLHAAFRSNNAAVKNAGYTTDDVSNISVNDMSGHSRNAIRRQEQSVFDQYGGINGGVLLNRRNEIS
ncbi:pretoxin HINT domain-containing protein [Isoptericola sp. CG 20/1183]|nr:pretoxin HINT domain-containing protein [Isoptericola sp. CG 20/1183]